MENHWRITVSVRRIGIVQGYDSIHKLQLFLLKLQDIYVLAEFLSLRYNLSDWEWPPVFEIREEMFSILQANSDNCWFFFTMNVFCFTIHYETKPYF